MNGEHRRARAVREVMTKGVLTVGAGTAPRDIAALLSAVGISAVPVIDGRGRVLGVVSELDLLITADHAGITRADQLMSTPAITIHPEADTAEAAQTLIRYDIKRLPVVDRDGVLIGIVSRRDLVRDLSAASPDQPWRRQAWRRTA